MFSNRLKTLLTGLCALIVSLLVVSHASAQGTTTAQISGFVTMKDGGAGVAGATVTAIHVPTGSRFVTQTRAGGQYSLDGIRPGGPYTVLVAGNGFTTAQLANIYADVSSQVPANFVVSSDIVKLDAVTVGADRSTTFDSNTMGDGLTYSGRDIAQLSSVRQDIQDIANMDPRATLQQSANGDSNYTLSVQGQNPRENLILIDGVSATDNFGLNSNGYAGLRNPLPLPWIESFAFQLNQYDTVFGGYTGAILDATLRSGTNQFHGSVYGMYTGTNFRGPDPVVGLLGSHEAVQSHTYGATLGGPIIKDKLFFFLGYESFREIAQPPAQLFFPNDNAADTAVINSILAKAVSIGDTNIGSFFAPLHTWQQNFVGKIDWNISDSHKFEFTFRHNDGEAPLTYNYTNSTETSLSGSWYNSHRVDQSYTAKVNSDWSLVLPGLKSEAEMTYKKYNGTAALDGSDVPSATIYLTTTAGSTYFGTSSVGGAPPYELYLGPSPFYQYNALYTSEAEEHLYVEYAAGAHTFKFGGAIDRVQLFNAFIPNYLGSYIFSNVQDYLNGTPTGLGGLVAAAPGYTVASDLAHYAQTNISPVFQDTWKPNEALTLMAGLRMDYPYEPEKPILNQTFVKAYGFPNTATINGHYTVSPRFGFNYTLPTERKTQIHGGAGLFLGAAPFVWLENSFSTAGQLTSYTINNSTLPIPNYTFTGNPATQALPPVAAAVPVPSLDYASNDIHQPANWKENIAIDHQLPFWHMVITAAVDLTQVQKDMILYQTNLKQAPAGSGPAYMPDGAIRYAGNITPTFIGAANFVPGYTVANFYTNSSSPFTPTLEANTSIGPQFELANTDKGGSQEYTISLSRPFMDNWSWSVGYTHTHATQVYAFGGTTAGGSYGTNYFVNPNDNIAYRSVYAAPDKVVANLTRRFKFIPYKSTATTFSAQFIAQTGQAYSYTFKGDADGSGQAGSSLFYVPTGPNDPKVAWLSQTEENNFFNTYLPQHPDLAKYQGQIAPRNAFYTAWQKTLNLHVEQEVPVYGPAKLTLFADCFNFANLLNKNWGVVMNYGAYNDQGGRTTVAGTGFNPAGNNGAGQYLYVFNPGTTTKLTTYSDESRWTVQVGARLEF